MKVLVIQQKMIGDVLTSSIIFEALRFAYPQAELHYLVEPHTVAVVENNPYIDKLILFYPEQNKSIGRFAKFTNQLRKENYNLVIDVYSKISTALLSIRTGASMRISYRKWYTGLAYTHTVKRKVEPVSWAGLAIEHRMALLQPLKADFPDILKPKIYLSPQEIERAKTDLEKGGIDTTQPLLMANILGSSPDKTYPVKYMAALLDYVAAEFKPQILFNYIPSQAKLASAVFEFCAPETREKIFLECYGRNLREFIAITSLCDALIGNEGGAINAAKAVDVPTFAIFSPQIDKKTWSIFEDGKNNVSVHLGEFDTQTLQDKSPKELAGNSGAYYQRFKPHYIIPQMKSFLTEHLIIPDIVQGEGDEVI